MLLCKDIMCEMLLINHSYLVTCQPLAPVVYLALKWLFCYYYLCQEVL